MKKITLSADERLIEAARARAREEHSSLNQQFRQWLAAYVRRRDRMERYDKVAGQLRGKLRVGRKLTRDAMHER